MAKLNAGAFADFVKARCKKKDGYIFGGRGEYTKNVSKNSWYINQYSGTKKTKALDWLAKVERIWDCWGFAEGYVNQETGSNIDIRAKDGYSSWCDPKGKGKIPAAKRVPGAAVFMGDGTAGGINHVGFLLQPVNADKPTGDWYVGEARGVMYGCVITKLSERSWTHWGWMSKYFDYTQAAIDVQPEPVEASDGDDNGMGDSQKNLNSVPARILRYKAGQQIMRGDDVSWVQLELCAEGDGYKVDIDGDYGPKTAAAVRKFQKVHNCEVDGEVGPETIAAMIACYGDHPMPEPSVKKGIIIDVSHHNGTDWDQAVAAHKLDMAIVRVQDNTVLDRNLKTNVKAMDRLGIPYGFYAFIECKTKAAAKIEADLYMDRALAACKGLAQPRIWMVDAEKGNSAASVQAFGEQVRARLVALGVEPLVGLYACDYDMINRYKGILSKFDRIWTADWRKACKVWSDLWCKKTDLWQCGYIKVKGLGGTVDENRLPDGVTVEEFLTATE